jgi:Family of unknown function (DUF6262)
VAVATKSDYELRVTRLKKAARAKSEEKTALASRAITKMDASGVQISFASVAKVAGVSTDFLYRSEALRNRIMSIRSSSRGPRQVPRAETASVASREVQIAELRTAIKELRTERDRLRQENEILRGDLLALRQRHT